MCSFFSRNTHYDAQRYFALFLFTAQVVVSLFRRYLDGKKPLA